MDGVQALPLSIAVHCRAVSVVAQRLAQALQAAGVFIDLDLVRTAALLHDIARDVSPSQFRPYTDCDPRRCHPCTALPPVGHAAGKPFSHRAGPWSAEHHRGSPGLLSVSGSKPSIAVEFTRIRTSKIDCDDTFGPIQPQPYLLFANLLLFLIR